MNRLILAFASACALVAAPPVTLEWIHSPEGRAYYALPRTLWLKDGGLLLDDVRKPAGERTLERLDPATGERRAALDAAKALGSLQAATGAKEKPARLPWPLKVDDAGRRALVQQGSRFLILDLATSEARALPKAEAASLSPDGRRAAYAEGGNLHLLDLESGKDLAVTRDGGNGVLNGTFSWVYWEEIHNRSRQDAFWWSPDSRRVAFLRSDESRVPVHSFTDFRPWQAAVHTQHYPQTGQPNPQVKVGIAALDGAVAWVDLPKEGWEYVVTLTWTPNGDALAVQTVNRAQDALELLLADPATGSARSVLRERSKDWVHFYEPTFIAGGKEFLIASDRTGYNHLYRYDRSGRLLNPVTRGEWSIWPWGYHAAGARNVAGVDEKGGWVWFTSRAAGITQSQLYRARLDGSAMERVSREDGTHAVTFSPDARYYVDSFSSAKVPPALALRGADGSLRKALAEPRAGLDLALPELGTYPAADGLRLPVSVLKPRDFDPSRRYPVIFYVYGGPTAPLVADAWGTRDLLWNQVLSQAGYIVVTPENRSSAGIGMTFESTIRNHFMGHVETGDLEAAVKWAKAQPWADPARFGIWGWSGGGTYTLVGLTRTREFKAGAAVAAVTDWHYYDSVYAEKIMKRPEDNPEGYKATSLVEGARNLHGRLLMVHGTHDDNVHPQNAEAFNDALVKAGILFEQSVYPMRKHGIDDAAANLHVYRTMLDFWKRNL
ncbi:MAG TPA: DPP IV N-terminal domain-containing protein [Holophaga sp.]|nr:DPP IV N-terminal domain-containing protein [Holophaga sp.]